LKNNRYAGLTIRNIKDSEQQNQHTEKEAEIIENYYRKIILRKSAQTWKAGRHAQSSVFSVTVSQRSSTPEKAAGYKSTEMDCVHY